MDLPAVFPSSTGHVESRVNLGKAADEPKIDRPAADAPMPRGTDPADIAATDDQLAITYDNRPKSVLVDRADWARSYATLAGALERPRRGLFVLTPLGREILALPEEEARKRILELDREVRARRRERAPRKAAPEEIPAEDDEIDEHGHANNVRYVAWMQSAAVAHSSAQGWTPQRYRELGSGWEKIQKEKALSDRPVINGSLRRAGWGFAAASAGIFVAAPLMAEAAMGIAAETGISSTFIGTSLVAIVTSLPEMVTTFAAFVA